MAYNILKKYELKETSCIEEIENTNIIESILETGINIIKIIGKNSIINKKIQVNIDNLIDKDIFIK